MTRYRRHAILVAATIAALGPSGTGCSSNGSPGGTGAGGASSGGAIGSGGSTGSGGATGSGGGVGGRGTGGSATGGSASGGRLGSGGLAASGGAAGGSAGVAGGAGRGSGGAGGLGGAGGAAGAAGRGTGGVAGGAGGGCPAASATGEIVTSLAGTWTFTPSGAAATTIAVPGGGWVAQGFRSTNEATYQRMATVPNLGRAQATYLEFGAINHQATLTVDSTMVGTQTTSFTPSVWDVTSVVKPGMSHSFTVDVKGRNALKGSSGKKLVPDAAGWSGNVAQGIFRSAVLHVVPALHVFETLVRTDVAADQFSIDVWVKNDGASTATGTVDVGLSSWTCDGTTYPSVPSKSVSVPAGQTVKVTLGPITWGLGATSYWWPNVPYVQGYRAKLHVARVTVTPDAAGGGAAAAHSIPVRFGFRQIRQVTAHYELNGVPIKFRGDNVQGADYDSIKTAGAKDNSDAYDLFPGFLPPSANNPGWPQAVDNWQRLNFNVARLHQEPVSPYMLDVMDEMGMMVIDESAIRGSNNDQDFMAGSANMIAHLNALVHRDRNHPCVIRWSQCNEPEGDSTNSSAFQQQLYQTVVAADDTRPVSADASGSGPNILNGYGITSSNFTAFEHYPSGFGAYTHDVAVSTTHPYGDGEFIWPADNGAQGLMWFATSTVTLRQKDPSDIRPYTLLSAWASFVPGVKANMMTIEQGGPPLYTEDNLPMPWSNPIITRVQQAFNPVAVIDTAYWDANHASDKSGAWPISKPAISKGAQVSRQLMVFNDTLSGTGVDVAWEMHQDTATGAMSGQGTMHLDIPLGGHATVTATVTAPASGTTAVLVLKSSKNGTILFEDDGEAFALQ
jgi:hypothetical protein